jgi:hypothetical protein
MSKSEFLTKKMQAQFDELKAEIEKLKEKADQAETNLKLEYYTLIDGLHLKLETTEQKFLLLKQVNEEKWKEFNTELELIWDSLRELIKCISSP